MTSLLWIDLRCEKSQSDLRFCLSKYFRIHCVSEIAAIASAINRVSPHLLCFDYDYPDVLGLKTLRRTKKAFPSIPILMLTEYHSEELAIWAFRVRVWDYLVKPVGMGALCTRVAVLSELKESPSRGKVEAIYMPVCPIPTEIQFCRPSAQSKVTAPAISYIEANYTESVELNIAAHLCGLGRFRFSRVFKREQGVSFREFLNRYRINRAIELFKSSGASVTDVAFAVGFNHLSYFTQMFRRYVGFNPSKYLKNKGRF